MFSEVEFKAHLQVFLQDIFRECHEDKEAVAIIGDYMKNGTITTQQEQVLKAQFQDTLKAIGIVVPFALIPGASILMPVILKVAEAHHINLLPKDFKNL